MGEKIEKILAGIRWAAMFAPEICLFAPFDVVAVPIRDRIIPRSFKKMHPGVACREYGYSSMVCMPAKKYLHKGLFSYICSNYDISTGECMKYGKK